MTMLLVCVYLLKVSTNFDEIWYSWHVIGHYHSVTYLLSCSSWHLVDLFLIDVHLPCSRWKICWEDVYIPKLMWLSELESMWSHCEYNLNTLLDHPDAVMCIKHTSDMNSVQCNTIIMNQSEVQTCTRVLEVKFEELCLLSFSPFKINPRFGGICCLHLQGRRLC
jgi:hypothetical protein